MTGFPSRCFRSRAVVAVSIAILHLGCGKGSVLCAGDDCSSADAGASADAGTAADASASPDAGTPADAGATDAGFVPLESILLNGAHGTSTTIPNSVANSVAYTPADATDKSLVWTVCADHPVDCAPDQSGHCRTCTPATGRGSVTSDGIYTPPSSISGSLETVYLVACQGTAPTAICDWTDVLVLAPNGTPVISSFAANPSTIAAGGSSTLSWSVSGATSLSIDQGVGTVTGSSTTVAPAATTTYRLTATNASGSSSATATVTVYSAGSTTYGTGSHQAPTGINNIAGGGAKPGTSNGIDVTASPYGAKGDGSTDDTQAFRDAAAAAGSANVPLIVPKTSSFYVLTGTVQLTSSLIGLDHPTIKMVGADGSSSYQMFVVPYGNHPLWITGLHLDGGYDPTGLSAPGGDINNQYSHGIALYNAHDVTISDNLIENTMGDNIYLGSGTDSNGPNQNVLIDSNSLVNAFRCTIAFIYNDGVVVTNNVTVKRNTFVLTFDIEPNETVETNFNFEISFNEDSIPATLTPGTWDCEYDQVADINCRADGGNYYFHDNAVYSGPFNDFTGSFGTSWWRGTTCSNYSNLQISNNPP